ncbi:MAG: peptide ABC transporter substrate-binding protein [Chloroflexi bacterium]|nr:peptide ABC transporter substrate-binding protein [Chloroflexota bacterium]
MTLFAGKWSFLVFSALSGVVFFVAGCAGRPPETVETVVTVEVTVPVAVVETRVVEVTREVAKTVVVTATPVPTPAYVSKLNAAANTLVYPLAADPVTLDPQVATDEVSSLVLQQLYEGLYNLRGDGSTVPAAATGYQVSDDGKVYTVTLRGGMTWSDGKPVTAQHFVDGVCRTLEPATGNGYYHLLTDLAPVKGAKAFASGDVADCKKVGVKAVDDTTLQILLDRPAAFFPKLLAMRVFWPTRLDAIAASSAIRNPQSAIISNGPYLLTERNPGVRLVLTKNPTYWNAAQVAIERIELPVIPDSARQLALYEKGDVAVADFPPKETARLQADAGLSKELQVLVRPGTSYVGLNTQAGPTKNLAFRKAVASAIDRDKLIKEVLKQPWHVPARAVIPPNVPGYQGEDATVGYKYDLTAAKKFLAEAGYGPDKPVPPVELWTNRDGSNELLLKAIAEMLEAAGIPVRLTTAGWDVYLAGLDGCNKPNRADAAKTPAECAYSLYRMGWVMDYADPAAMLDVVFNPKSAFQYTGWQSKEYGDLLAKALAEPDEAKRLALYKQTEKILLNDAVAVVPLMYYDRTLLVKQAVKFDYPPFGAPNLQYWKLEAGS